jgi:hypothetical protein
MSQTNPSPINAPPTAPSIASPSTFAPLADAFIAWFSPFVTQINAAIVATYNNAVDAYNNAGIAAAGAATATTKASDAAASAASAFASAGTQATSTTSLTCGTGSKSLTLAQTGKLYSVGQTVNISDSAANNVMTGIITAFNSGTGAISVNVAMATGTATVASWIISVGAPVTASSSNTINIERAIRRSRDI